MKRATLLLVAAWVALLPAAAAPAAADMRYVCFGDSITAGIGDLTAPPSGYPKRLQKLLRKADLDVEVDNLGVPGEDTTQGLSRINAALAGGPDALLLMEGTNDIPLVEKGLYSIETVVDNLDRMARIANQVGTPTVHATVVPRRTRIGADKDNHLSLQLTFLIRELAIRTGRALADPWEAFDLANDRDSFDTLYAALPRDPVGHPNDVGYNRIAQVFADVLLGLDTTKPVPGGFWPTLDYREVPPGTTFAAIAYEPRDASGIDLDHAFLTINGRPVATPDPDLSDRRTAVFEFSGSKDVGCRAELGLYVADRNDPPNVTRRTLNIFDLKGRTVIQGDVDFDCLVDGFDLVAIARRVGAEPGDDLYAIRYDLNRDGIIDEHDIDRLAEKFGKKSR